MKDTVSRVGRITKYVVVPSELITPVSQRAAGAVVKVTKVVGSGPVTRQTERVRAVVPRVVPKVSVTRLRFRRGSESQSDPDPAPPDASS